MRRVLCGGVGVLGLLAAMLWPATAAAVVRAQSDYPFDQVWNVAVRLVRVDLGFEVTERDAEGGFILFKYRADMGGIFNASLEVVRPAADGKVGLVIQVPEMPRYTELWLLDRLNRKLRDEYGAPPPRVRRPTPPATDDTGREEGREGAAGQREGTGGGNGTGRSGGGSSPRGRRPSSSR